MLLKFVICDVEYVEVLGVYIEEHPAIDVYGSTCRPTGATIGQRVSGNAPMISLRSTPASIYFEKTSRNGPKKCRS